MLRCARSIDQEEDEHDEQFLMMVARPFVKHVEELLGSMTEEGKHDQYDEIWFDCLLRRLVECNGILDRYADVLVSIDRKHYWMMPTFDQMIRLEVLLEKFEKAPIKRLQERVSSELLPIIANEIDSTSVEDLADFAFIFDRWKGHLATRTRLIIRSHIEKHLKQVVKHETVSFILDPWSTEQIGLSNKGSNGLHFILR